MSIVDVLERRARETPDKALYTYLSEGEPRTLTYAGLRERALVVATHLRAACAPGERVVLAYPPGLEFIEGFFGCLYASVIAVPVAPPGAKLRRSRLLEGIVRNATPSMVLTSRSLAPVLERALSQAEGERVPSLMVSDTLEQPGDAFRRMHAMPTDVAFLQYTSGSTRAPRGVRVTHGNILHNQGQIAEAFGHTTESVILGWLPVFHDMGLIGNVLQPLFVGARCFLMSPLQFLRSPLSWLSAISEHRATTSGAPNFAYELCAQRFASKPRHDLDLSSWTLAFNGAEPVRAETLEKFARVFGPYGFRKEAFYPCYGLAEATLFVTGGKRAEAPRTACMSTESPRSSGDLALDQAAAPSLVGCGTPWHGQDVQVVDAQGVPLSDSQVGEIWVSGPSVADGYWNNLAESIAVFGKELAARPTDHGVKRYLRTGDLGFVRQGELFVTGRVKDLIIHRGRNLYPHDLEWAAEHSHRSLRPGSSVAFADDDALGTQVTLVAELTLGTEREAPAVFDAILRAIHEEYEVALGAIHLVRPNAVPRTSSGKVQRAACRALLRSGELTILASWQRGESVERAQPVEEAPRSEAEHSLLALWREVLNHPDLGVDIGFIHAGGDSLTAMKLLNRVEEVFGVRLDLESLSDEPTVRSMALKIAELRRSHDSLCSHPLPSARETQAQET